MLLVDTGRDAPPSSGRKAFSPTEILTGARLLLVPLLIGGIAVNSPYLTIGTLSTFVLVDVTDGILARRRGEDSLRRRAMDSTVDRFAIHAAFLTYGLTAMAVPTLWIALLARDCLQLPISVIAVRRGFIGVGAGSHKAIGIGTAVTGAMLVMFGQVPTTLTFVLVAALTWCTATYLAHMRTLLAQGASRGVISIPASLPRTRGNEGDE
ncbi:CDP-alcohol phosphatidyltransferase family protein [Nocardia sp. NPDC048505]|uniref:CDP-alcohol phosphatidyltransferase family protein n=1 Tax=unclassified Nocardia TaxID=2637762 RepID=UPI0033C2958F